MGSGIRRAYCEWFPSYSLFVFPIWNHMNDIFLFSAFPFIQTSNEVLFFGGADRWRFLLLLFGFIFFLSMHVKFYCNCYALTSMALRGEGAVRWRFIFNKFKSLASFMCVNNANERGERVATFPFLWLFVDKEQKLQKQFIPHSLPDTIWT